MRFSMALLGATALIAAPLAAQVGRGTLNPREVAESRQIHPQLVEEYGGAETGPRAAYVESIGRRIAAFTGIANPGQVYRFTTINSAVENAFATPGGYVYITRQLMGIMNDEAELAFVVGHEAGHIAARHSQARQAASRNNSILGALGAILGQTLGGGFGQAIAQGSLYQSKLRTLGFSRQQEYQADVLGIRYLIGAGYDPAASATMLSQLTNNSALQARIQGNANRSTPEWASTHPLSANRVTQASAAARQTGRAGTGARNRDAFLAQLDGVTVDDDPAQGVIEGRQFTHPDLRMTFTVPTGFLMQNGTREVSIDGGAAGQAQFSGGQFSGDMPRYIAAVLQELTGGEAALQLGPLQQTSVNGIPATYVIGRAQSSSGPVDVGVFAYRWDANTAYHFITLSRGGQGITPYRGMINSLRRISPAEAAAIRPRVIDVVQVRAGDTPQTLAARMAYRDYRLERFLVLNGLNANSRLVPGQKVKLVVYGARR
ncbi:M48 family metalloprotease [Sphingomonas sp. LY29]|uniref:M48 family metalloprotease n=1 Tax=unclassified Sphingomonas TaxID=196159 RepID=UPI002ADEEA69|nr:MULTISPECIES: M48 family metalloprotease [unclassified Sphingomonas]MEA1073265.1 M48 family metalloprotease [Sphingomonas sp. LY160]WRP26714.1 M48 family metalloprotease [Sphingomonas sp. LY29]